MRILIVTQYYWPENFRINDLSLALTERGHQVVVLTGKPNYPHGRFFDGYSFFSKRTEYWNGIKICRSPLIPRGKGGRLRLLMNYLSFAFLNALRGLFIEDKFDKIFVFEPSPITVGLPAILMKWKKKAPIYFWVQDLWPHSVVAAGGVGNRTVMKYLNKLTRWIYKKSDKILVQSEAFREIIENQGVARNNILFYPNSVEKLFSVSQPKDSVLDSLPVGFRIMFAGNIGEAQDFETIIEAARLVAARNPCIKWVILGDGRKRSYVKEKIIEFNLKDQVYLMGHYPMEKMPEFYACADCLLVSLKRDYIFSLTIPSKMQSYLACGRPILASIDGEGGKILIKAKAGLVVESESPEKLADKVLEFYNLTEIERNLMGKNARKYFEANFERELLVDSLEQILKDG